MASRLQAIVGLGKLEKDIEYNKKQLRILETENRKKNISGQHPLRPILKKMQILLDSRKQEIEQLRNQIEVTSEEIIHI